MTALTQDRQDAIAEVSIKYLIVIVITKINIWLLTIVALSHSKNFFFSASTNCSSDLVSITNYIIYIHALQFACKFNMSTKDTF